MDLFPGLKCQKEQASYRNRNNVHIREITNENQDCKNELRGCACASGSGT